MSAGDTDLSWLRHRRRPAVEPSSAAAVADFIAGRRPQRPSAATTPAAPSSLDLSPPTPSPPSAAPVERRPEPFDPPRTAHPAPTVLTARSPSVQLTRLQSGIGALAFEAVWPTGNGVQLQCAYQLRSGWSSVLRRGDNPASVSGPLLLDTHDEHQRLRLDLLQGRDLERLIIFGVRADGPPPLWGGTLVVSTFGRARIEVPLPPPPPHVTVLLSLFNIDGELILRAEMENIRGPVRDACLAFGFERIAWRDADTPVD